MALVLSSQWMKTTKWCILLHCPHDDFMVNRACSIICRSLSQERHSSPLLVFFMQSSLFLVTWGLFKETIVPKIFYITI